MPDGKEIVCSKPRRYGELAAVRNEARNWIDTLFADWEALQAGEPALRPEEMKVINNLPGGDFPSVDELIAAYFVKKYPVSVSFSDVQVIKMIGAPQLLNFLYTQINSAISVAEKTATLKQVEIEGEDLGQTLITA